MPALIDLKGQRFGRLIVLKEAGRSAKRGSALWFCRCDCQNTTTVDGSSLRRGLTRSCDCLKRERVAERARKLFTTHGHYQRGKASPTYVSWNSMLTRCTNPKHVAFHRYGGANPPVLVCERWDPAKGGSFENFLADMGPRPEGTTLGRYRDQGMYEPGNCAWMTWAEQGAERRKKCTFLRAAA